MWPIYLPTGYPFIHQRPNLQSSSPHIILGDFNIHGHRSSNLKASVMPLAPYSKTHTLNCQGLVPAPLEHNFLISIFLINLFPSGSFTLFNFKFSHMMAPHTFTVCKRGGFPGNFQSLFRFPSANALQPYPKSFLQTIADFHSQQVTLPLHQWKN